jgi:flagellar protein FlgJ
MDAVQAASAGATTLTKAEVGRLRNTAQEIESIFLQQMLKLMRQASPNGQGPLSGQGQRVYQEMMDEQMGRALAKGGGLGLADMLIRDVLRRQAAPKKPSSEPAPVPMERMAGSDPGQGGDQ